VEGGYSGFDTESVHAFDVGPDDDNMSPVYFQIDDGWYARGEAGYVPAQPFGPVDALSIALAYYSGSDDPSATAGTTALAYNFPPDDATSTRSPGTAVAEQDFALFDVQLRLKHVPAAWPGINVNVEPFYSRLEHDVSATVDNPGGGNAQTRTAELDSDFFGGQLAIEGQHPLTQIATVRGRASLGGYYGNADGKFTFAPFLDRKDELSKVFGGVRAGGEIGVDFAVAPNISLGVTAGVDYWSSMPFPRLTEFIDSGDGLPQIGIDDDDLLIYFVGARLTVATGAE
jgi:hypothetical protein